MTSDDVVQLQRTAGNQAVQRLVGGMLRVGSGGPEVARLQRLLGVKADGKFGPRTRAAVVAFQRRARLSPDGIVGPKTWAALEGGAVPGPPLTAEGQKLKTLYEILSQIQKRLGETATGQAQNVRGFTTVEPQPRHSWFDDAADWVEEKAGAAADWAGDMAAKAVDVVSETASDVGSWVSDKAGAAASWAGEKVDEATNAATSAAAGAADWVGEQAGGASDWVQQQTSAAQAAASDIAAGVANLAKDYVESLPAPVKEFLGVLTDIINGGGLHGPALDDLVKKAAAAHGSLAGADGVDELSAGGGAGTLDFNLTTVDGGGSFTFDDATFQDLRKTLTARTEEIGSATPGAPTLTINGQDGSKLDGAEIVKSAKVTVSEVVTLPKWTKVGSASTDEAAAWNSYRAGVSAHEGLHVADDKSIYGKAAASLPGKTVTQAYEAIDQATDDGNAQGPKRDASDPAPTLQNAGTEKVP